MRIEYTENGPRGLDLVAPLWEKLRAYQQTLSRHFPGHYANRTWQARRAELLEKDWTGALHVHLAKDLDTGKTVGYCVSTVSQDGQGRLESIFIEPDYRNQGIGDNLMQRAVDWMNERQARTKMLIVGTGNEEVFNFYRRYRFYPKHVTLEQAD